MNYSETPHGVIITKTSVTITFLLFLSFGFLFVGCATTSLHTAINAGDTELASVLIAKGKNRAR